MNKALGQVRAEETGRLKREGRDPVLKKSRWLLLRRSENLGAEQHFRLRDLLRYNLKTVRTYLLKEAFQQLWGTTRQPEPASSSTSGAPDHAFPHRADEEDRAISTLSQGTHLELFPRSKAAFQRRRGRAEQPGVTMRKSYGFRTYRVLECALYHSLGKLAEPASTHDVF
jgi:hypothetical protein